MDYTLRTDRVQKYSQFKDDSQKSSQVRNRIKRIYYKNKQSKKSKAYNQISYHQAQSMLAAKNKEMIYFIQKLFNSNLNPIKINSM